MSVQRSVAATWIVGALLVGNAMLRDVDSLAAHDDLFGNVQVVLTVLFVLLWGVAAATWSRRRAEEQRVPLWCTASVSVSGVLILAFFLAMMRFVVGG